MALDNVRSNFSAGACNGMGGGGHMFIDPPFLHFPTAFFSIKFHEEPGRGDDHVCTDGRNSFLEGSSFYLSFDSKGSFGISRKMTLSIEYEVRDAEVGVGIASVEPLYSFVYSTNWDGRAGRAGLANEEWMMIRPEGHVSVPVGKAQDLPVSIELKDLMAMAQWPQLLTIKRDLVTGPEVKLFYLLEFDVMVEGESREASLDALSEHVVLSLELHACAHADWRSPWNTSGSFTLDQAPNPPLSGMLVSNLPGSGLRHTEGREAADSGDEGQWSHYKCSAGKHWFDDAEVGSASSSGMHAESARHVNRLQPQPPCAACAYCDKSQARLPVLRPLHDSARYIVDVHESSTLKSHLKFLGLALRQV
jgi:hypothetical protein